MCVCAECYQPARLAAAGSDEDRSYFTDYYTRNNFSEISRKPFRERDECKCDYFYFIGVDGGASAATNPGMG